MQMGIPAVRNNAKQGLYVVFIQNGLESFKLFPVHIGCDVIHTHCNFHSNHHAFP